MKTREIKIGTRVTLRSWEEFSTTCNPNAPLTLDAFRHEGVLINEAEDDPIILLEEMYDSTVGRTLVVVKHENFYGLETFGLNTPEGLPVGVEGKYWTFRPWMIKPTK